MATDNQRRGVRADHPTARSAVLARRLQERLQQLAAPQSIQHAVISVEKGDDTFRWSGAIGDAHPDGTPMHADTPIWIASVTKLYIASSILKLYERGLIHLDAPMSTYLPQSLIGGLHRLGGVDYTEQITVHHLLGHLTGLPDYLDSRPKGEKTLIEQLIERDFGFTIVDMLDTVRHKLTPHFPPQPLDARRPKVRYSDTNYQLLIAIIETVTSQPIHAVFANLLFEPLGLGHTWHPAAQPESVKPATIWIDKQPLHIPLAMRSFGDLSSTVADLLKFMRALIRGKVFDDPATVNLMTQHWHTFGFSLNPVRTSPGWPIQYGLGMMRFHIPRFFSPLRPTPPVIGHSGATGSWLFYCPDLDVYFAGTVNQIAAAAAPFRFVPKLLHILATEKDERS
ncbi:MAG: serine hydrolase domain-containing protein [Caldilinea sp.]